jgi:fumarate reductase subunit C
MSVKTPSKNALSKQQKWNYNFEFIHEAMLREIVGLFNCWIVILIIASSQQLGASS